MKKTLLICFLFALLFPLAYGQGLNTEQSNHLTRFLELLDQNKVATIANNVRYPLKRQSPVPNIQNADEFILCYPMLFDEGFKKLLLSTTYDKDHVITGSDEFGLLNGDLWFSSSGQLIAVNHQSDAEKRLAKQLHNEQVKSIHSSVAPWKRNVMIFQSTKFLIRIDEMSDYSLRYVSWNRPDTQSDEPALILKDGEEEFQGTAGGETYTFKSGDFSYVIDHVRMAESEEQMGTFLRLYQDGKRILNVKGEQIK